MTNRTILITGASGFLGNYITKYAIEKGYRVVGIDKFCTEGNRCIFYQFYEQPITKENISLILRTHNISACVHAAGSASVPLSIENPHNDFLGNVVTTFECLDAIKVTNPLCKFILLSSAAVYGNPTTMPITELQEASPISPYGYHKLQAEALCKEFYQLYKIPTSCLRIFSAYGNGLKKQVIWDICQKTLDNNTIILHGTGKETRDFIHAQDIASALFILLENGSFLAEIYNVANGKEVSIEYLAVLLKENIIKYINKDISIKFNNIQPLGNPINWRADVSKIKNMGFSPTISLEKGISNFVYWWATSTKIN